MHPIAVISLGLIAGVHAAMYGAWKDSPHEDFLARRVVREIAIALCVAALLTWVADGTTAFIFVLSVFALTRITTEFYKLFLRTERQDHYRIPTQVHVFKTVPRALVARIALGIGWLSAIYGLYALLRLLPDQMSPHLVGPIAGVLFGSSLALAGAYKDGYIEGFYLHKFLKSPVSAAVAGFVVAFHTAQLEFIVLGTIALERMFNEYLYKLRKPGYVPGKFQSVEPRFPQWVSKRRWFLVPYAATWGIILALYVWPPWHR
jgi:hypothetical protein